MVAVSENFGEKFRNKAEMKKNTGKPPYYGTMVEKKDEKTTLLVQGTCISAVYTCSVNME